MITVSRSRAVFASKTERKRGIANLKHAIVSAQTYGFSGLELEGRLALAELQIASGDTSAASVTLTDVAQEARSRGLRPIYNEASEN